MTRSSPFSSELFSTVFDFGAVSVALHIPFQLPPASLSRLASGLADIEFASLQLLKFREIDNEYRSVQQMKGSLSQAYCPDPAAFERCNYMKALALYTGEFI